MLLPARLQPIWPSSKPTEQVSHPSTCIVLIVDRVFFVWEGTSLGDPIEYRALCELLRPVPPAKPVLLGSIKSNLGHLEAAAGVLGLIKVGMSFIDLTQALSRVISGGVVIVSRCGTGDAACP
jgi:hypothetical protein